jgi:mannose/fructose/N-acetylgalactosamine-specific phosphotransferase system component IIB
MQDLSKHQGTLANALEPLIGRMASLTASEIRMEFLTLLVSDSTKISTATCAKWINAINNAKTKDRMMFTISNAYLAGSALKVA